MDAAIYKRTGFFADRLSYLGTAWCAAAAAAAAAAAGPVMLRALIWYVEPALCGHRSVDILQLF
jgi:hypothetical protein